MSDKDTTSPDHTDLSELREELKAAHNRFHGRFDTHGEVAVHAQWTPQELENVQIEDEELFYDEILALFQQYAQPPVVADEELREKLEWVQSCQCDRCPRGHSQAETGCPSCDFAHAEYRLFSNKEVLDLIQAQHLYARQDVKAICEKVVGTDTPNEWEDDEVHAWPYYDDYSSNAADYANGYNQAKSEQRQSIDSIIDKWGK